MSLVDRFICRREGHVPSLTITGSSGVVTGSVLCTCVRCGKWIEAPLPHPAPAEDGGNHRKEKGSSNA